MHGSNEDAHKRTFGRQRRSALVNGRQPPATFPVPAGRHRGQRELDGQAAHNTCICVNTPEETVGAASCGRTTTIRIAAAEAAPGGGRWGVPEEEENERPGGGGEADKYLHSMCKYELQRQQPVRKGTLR